MPTYQQLAELDIAEKHRFREGERDSRLHLANQNWPAVDIGGRWTIPAQPDAFGPRVERNLWPVTEEQKAEILNRYPASEPDAEVDLGDTTVLREQILRFPSAIIHWHSLATQNPYDPSSGFHSLRVLSNTSRLDGERPDRIYLLINGLNEVDGLPFFYQLAGWILAKDPRSVCIIRPLPAHLTRYPHDPLFASKPLDQYMTDATELFRHYLRYMVESKWLLSALAPRAEYKSLAGLELTDPARTNPAQSRAEDGDIAAAIAAEYEHLWYASDARARGDISIPSTVPDSSLVESSIRTVRALLGWSAAENSEPDPEICDRPVVHTVGYSLGGFVAQSIFMSWPNVVGSCTTVCSGGALRELAPTAFSHPEEWQSLLYALRFRLDAQMMSGLYGAVPISPRPGSSDAERLADGSTRRDRVERRLGIDSGVFHDLLNVFYEVFEQDYRESYRTRVSEYVQRLLFVVGGNDPIVRPASVLASAPSEGANIISIADLSHFLGARRPQGTTEDAQQRFWLPEIGALIARFAQQAEKPFQRGLAEAWQRSPRKFAISVPQYWRIGLDPSRGGAVEYPAAPEQLTQADRTLIGPDGALGWPVFDRSIESLVNSSMCSETGYVFVLRNEIPTFMLPPSHWPFRARVLYYSDERQRRYLDSLEWKRKQFERFGKRAVVVLPEGVLERTIYDPELSMLGVDAVQRRSASQTLRARQRYLQSQARRYFSEHWLSRAHSSERPMIRWFTPGDVDMAGNGEPMGEDLLNEQQHGRDFWRANLREFGRNKRFTGVDRVRLSRLPDLWLSVSDTRLNVSSSSNPRVAALANLYFDLGRAAAVLSDSERRLAGETIANMHSRGLLRLIAMSRTRENPRMRGRLAMDSDDIFAALMQIGLIVLRTELATAV